LNSDGAVPEIVRMLGAHGAEIEEVVKNKASLEDVFLTLVEENPRA
jgi:hypothetical protein